MEELKEGEFIFGVLDVYLVKGSDDLVVVGKLKGSLKKGDRLYISNCGDDDDELFISSVVSMDIDAKDVDEAKDCFVAIRVKDGMMQNIKPGTVVRSENIGEQDIRTAYQTALIDSYIAKRKFTFTEEDLNRMSLTDCAETWKLSVAVLLNSDKKDSKEEIERLKRKSARVAEAIVKKLIMADEIYCIYNKITGEPHMFSRTFRQGSGFVSTPPDIKLFTKAYKKIAEENYPADKFEVVRIDNLDTKDGIKKFLFDAFFLNGAYGVRIISDTVAIPVEMILEDPNGINKDKNLAPMANPNLVRWMLLRAQIGKPQNEEEEMAAKIFYRFFAREVAKANFIIPMKPEGEMPEPDENGKRILKEETKLIFPVRPGQNGRTIIPAYTDWKKLRMEYNEEWGGLVQPMSAFINKFDCSLNVTKNAGSSCFISKDMFDEIVKIAEADAAPKEE
ncbi:MAG: hypothetical protein MJ126_06235 [Lachnospiraceae bacterium]|nr:hypothetical protein [Lachnospiraceae bacterium]